jgi:hypothetical protein
MFFLWFSDYMPRGVFLFIHVMVMGLWIRKYIPALGFCPIAM